MRPARIVVIGSTNTDMVVKTPRIPAPGETVLGGEFLMVPGGKGANQAVAAARLGAEVWFVGRIGRDMFGENARKAITEAGVRTDHLKVDPAHPSGIALIYVDERGQNSIVVAPGANAAVSPEDVDSARSAMEQCDVVCLQLEIPLATVRHAISCAKALGKQVVLNPAPAPREPLDLVGVDVLTPNEVEACMLSGVSPGAEEACQNAARGLLTRGVGAAVVTLGARGAVVATADRIQHVPARRVKAVDATAAGDCFTAALAVAVGEGREIGVAAHFANAAAAISVSRMGAQFSLPTRTEVEEFLSRR